MKKIILVFCLVLLTNCMYNTQEPSKEVKPEYPPDFNVKLSYAFDKEIIVSENKYILQGCYPESNFDMPFSIEDKNWLYNEIIKQDLINYDWKHSTVNIREAHLGCPYISTDGNLFSLAITLHNKTNKIIESTGDCCCITIPSEKEYVVPDIKWLNETEIYEEIKNTTILKIYEQQKELWEFNLKIQEMIQSKIKEYNITEPEFKPDCGYI